MQEAMKTAQIGVIDMDLLSEFAEPGDVEQLSALQQQVQDYLTMVRKICSDCDVEYHPLNTKETYDKALVQLIHRRS